MQELFASPFFGIALSAAAFWAGVKIRKKTGLEICNPLVIAIVLVSGVLLLFKIPYESYEKGGEIINMFLAPATACLAVSIYTRIELLKKNWLPVVVGAACGSAASMGSVYVLCRLFRMDEAMTASLDSKIGDDPHCGKHRRGQRRHYADHGSRRDLHRDSGKYFCPEADQAVWGKGSDDGGRRDRVVFSCGWNFQSAGAGRNAGRDERSCDRRMRCHDGIVFNAALTRRAILRGES